MTKEIFVFIHANIVMHDQILYNGVLQVKNGIIVFVGPYHEWQQKQLQWVSMNIIDVRGGWLLPGFIDLHIHGGYGADYLDATITAYDTITKFHMEHGTTTMLATLMTQSQQVLEHAIAAIYHYTKQKMKYAQINGIHLEGPFLNPIFKGAQNEAFMLDPQIDWLEDWQLRFPGIIKQVSLAPERKFALKMIRWLRMRHINVAAAHTAASYDEMMLAVHAGLNQAAHTFNAMTPLHHREPGVTGVVLSDDRIIAEIIPDGIHVHPACIYILTRTKATGKLIVITDSISAAGMPDGKYQLGGLDVILAGGVCRLAESKSLAGSTLTMIEAVKNMVQFTNLPLYKIGCMASLNAARQLGIDRMTGSLEVGKYADLVWADVNFHIKRVWVRGRTHM